MGGRKTGGDGHTGATHRTKNFIYGGKRKRNTAARSSRVVSENASQIQYHLQGCAHRRLLSSPQLAKTPLGRFAHRNRWQPWLSKCPAMELRCSLSPPSASQCEGLLRRPRRRCPAQARLSLPASDPTPAVPARNRPRHLLGLRKWAGVNGGVLAVAALVSQADACVYALMGSRFAAALVGTVLMYALAFSFCAANLSGRPRAAGDSEARRRQD